MQRKTMETSGKGFCSNLCQEQLLFLLNTHLFLCRLIRSSELFDYSRAVFLNLLAFQQCLFHCLQFLTGTELVNTGIKNSSLQTELIHNNANIYKTSIISVCLCGVRISFSFSFFCCLLVFHVLEL